MSGNKIKYTYQNLRNILDENNLGLVQFQNRQHIVSNAKQRDQKSVLRDNNGYYTLEQNGQRRYLFDRAQYGLMPNWCPKCGHIMGRNNLDQKYWVIHKMCFKCSIAFQTQMKLDGSWEQYQIRYLLNNLINTCEEAIQFYQHLKTHSARSVLLNQEGETQDWDVSGIQQFNNQLDQFIKEIELFKTNSIEQAQTEIKLLNESKLDQQVLQSEVFVSNTTDNIVDSNNDDEN